MTNAAMKIGEVAERTGLSTQTIRYYEREGLLARPERTHTGYRMYGTEVLGRLNFIRQARALGLSLDEIKEVFETSRAGHAPCCRVRNLLGEKIGELDRKITDLCRFRERLQGFLEKLTDVPDQADTSQQVCALIEMAPKTMPLPGLPERGHQSSDGTENLSTRPEHLAPPRR